MTVFVDVCSEDLLILIVYRVDVVDKYNLFLVWNGGTGFAKGLHIRAVIADTLLFETVDIKNVALR